MPRLVHGLDYATSPCSSFVSQSRVQERGAGEESGRPIIVMRTLGIVAVCFLLGASILLGRHLRRGESKPSRGDQRKAPQKQELVLAFQAVDKRVLVGARPRFRLTIKNVSNHPCRVLTPFHLPYMCHIMVTKNGRVVSLGAAVSDPVFRPGGMYTNLAPGATQVILLSSYPEDLGSLPAGHYKAHVLLWLDPVSIKSPETGFEVRPRQPHHPGN